MGFWPVLSSKSLRRANFQFLSYLKVWAAMFSTFSASIRILAQKYTKYPNFSLECVSEMILWPKSYFVESLHEANFRFFDLFEGLSTYVFHFFCFHSDPGTKICKISKFQLGMCLSNDFMTKTVLRQKFT